MNSDPQSSMTVGEFVGADDPAIANIDNYGDLTQAIDRLDPRERLIIIYRFFQDMSQADVANRLKISQMHVSRLQNHALRQLKRAMDER
jgi:RNA polymerase sigma-B factor